MSRLSQSGAKGIRSAGVSALRTSPVIVLASGEVVGGGQIFVIDNEVDQDKSLECDGKRRVSCEPPAPRSASFFILCGVRDTNWVSSTTNNTTRPSYAGMSSASDSNTSPVEVRGQAVTPLTQCAHWHSPLDIIAIKHACCNQFYACISCHDELEEHESTTWPASKRDKRAVLCGQCKYVLRVDEYLQSGSQCTQCGAKFNPGCRNHWALYFEIDGSNGEALTCD